MSKDEETPKPPRCKLCSREMHLSHDFWICKKCDYPA